MLNKRSAEVVVISDVHLGTYGCHAEELNRYLASVQTPTLILNGDIIDGWSFNKNYFPPSHIAVIQRILMMMAEGTQVYYLTGNHDETLRRFNGMKAGNLKIYNKLILILDNKVHWFFHGDVFDITMKSSKWLARLGGKGYNILILLNRFINYILIKLKKEKISLSKRIKNGVKQAISYISDFEQTAVEIAAENEFDYVICGHIHQPADKTFDIKGRKIRYLNSGDWVENLTALEYNNGKWSLVYFDGAIHTTEEGAKEKINHAIPTIHQLYEDLVLHTRDR